MCACVVLFGPSIDFHRQRCPVTTYIYIDTLYTYYNKLLDLTRYYNIMDALEPLRAFSIRSKEYIKTRIITDRQTRKTCSNNVTRKRDLRLRRRRHAPLRYIGLIYTSGVLFPTKGTHLLYIRIIDKSYTREVTPAAIYIYIYVYIIKGISLHIISYMTIAIHSTDPSPPVPRQPSRPRDRR